MTRGSVEQLPSGSWRAVVRAGRDPLTGKQAKLTETCATEAAAIAARERLQALVEAEALPDRATTLETLLEKWLEISDHEQSTAYTYRGYIRRSIPEPMKQMRARTLQHRVDLFDRLYKHLSRCARACDGTPQLDHRYGKRGPDDHDCARAKCPPHVCKPLGPNSIHQIHSILRAAFDRGAAWGLVERNPVALAKPPTPPRRRARPPETDAVAQLLNSVWPRDPEFGLYLWLAVTTGARRAELTGLRWSRVRFAQSEILLWSNYLVVDGKHVEKSTKTDEDRRLSLDETTLRLLGELKAERETILARAGLTLDEHAFVFSPDPVGSRPWSPGYFSHRFREEADAVGIDKPLKNLRHFNATQLLAAGTDLRTTAGRLGHSDGGATTLRVYADWTRGADRAAAEGLSRQLDAERRLQAANGATQATGALKLRRLAQIDADLEDLFPGEDHVTSYVQIAGRLRAVIVSGELADGATVPTIIDLGRRFGVAPSTALRAVQILAQEGLAVRNGRRWLVADPGLSLPS